MVGMKWWKKKWKKIPLANRGLLAKHLLEDFKLWVGKSEPTKSEYEVFRWREDAKRVGIIFKRHTETPHYTANDVALPTVRRFINERKRHGRKHT